jgi:16S rRNA processing protein RimM
MGKFVGPVSTLPRHQSAEHELVKNRVCVARIGAAHGTGGEVRLWPFTARAEDVAAYGPLLTADGTRAFEIEALRPGKDFWVARLKDVTDRATAERLRNTDLYVPRERLPTPEAEEFYHADLIGLRAEDEAGRAIGAVTAVHNFGAGDILEIAPDAGGETLMLPFSTAVVPRVEVAAGHIVVEIPEGLFASAPTLPSPAGGGGKGGGASGPVTEKNKKSKGA